MKKIVCLICVLALLCGMMLTSCGSSDISDTVQPVQGTATTISVSHADAKPGEKTVEVALSVWNNPGIVGMTLDLDYDESVLTLTAIKRGDALSELNFTKPKDLADGCRLPWDAETVSAEEATNGVALILRFTVSDTAAPGEYKVVVRNYGDIIDDNLAPVPVVFEDGGVTVS